MELQDENGCLPALRCARPRMTPANPAQSREEIPQKRSKSDIVRSSAVFDRYRVFSVSDDRDAYRLVERPDSRYWDEG